MSIWYQLEVTALAKSKSPVAKFFGLDDDYKDVRTDRFQFSFGGKNAPSLTLKKIVEKNPDLIFLVKQEVEVDTVEWFVTRWDSVKNEQQFFWIQDFGSVTNKVSKKVLEQYHKEFGETTIKHLNGQKGFEDFRWEYFFGNFDQTAEMLNHAEEYREMVNPWAYFNIKTYVVEYECNYGDKDDPSWHKEWQGPHPAGKIESIKEKIASYVKEGRAEIRNINVKEVEPK